MTKLEQAARQALEALEELHYSSGTAVAVRMYESATAALREALAEQSVQEPVAWVNEERNTITWDKLYQNMTPLYAATVRTKDLTDDEIAGIHGCPPAEWVIHFARAVIAADREKNK